MSDKDEATRLADALRRSFPTYGDGTRSDRERLAIDAAAMLERWPDGEPVAWLYEARYIDTAWTVCVGLNNPGPEGAYLRGVRPLYTAQPADAERIAALDKLPQRYIGASVPLQMVLHMAALETALGQAKVALGALLTHMGMDEDEWNKPTFDQARAVLRAIEEVRK